jgi:hypothetical protein
MCTACFEHQDAQHGHFKLLINVKNKQRILPYIELIVLHN